MNFRKRSAPQHLGFQIAPMVDIFLVLLVFFIVTWNVALSENAIDVKVPSADSAEEQKPYMNQVVLNIRKDGSVVLNRKPISSEELAKKLSELAELFPDQAVVLRGDEELAYKDMIAIVDLCRGAKIWNLLFATSETESQPKASAARPRVQ
jgi:biopolymer transport protein ExbD